MLLEMREAEIIYFEGQVDTGVSRNECQMTIYTCYESCGSCVYENKDADSMNHLCSSCKAGYIQLEDNPKSCFLPTDDVPGYVYSGGVFFKACYLSCDSCNDVGTLSNHLCLTCKTDYYFLKGDLFLNCYNTPPIGSYFNLAIPNYSKCNPSCINCFELGIDPLTKCAPQSCSPGFSFLKMTKHNV